MALRFEGIQHQTGVVKSRSRLVKKTYARRSHSHALDQPVKEGKKEWHRLDSRTVFSAKNFQGRRHDIVRIVSSISTISCVEYCFQGEATTQSFRWMNHPSWLDRSKDFDTLLSSLARAHRLSESGSLKRLFWRSHSSFNKASFAAKGPVLHRSHFLCRKKEKRDCILLGNRMGGKRGDVNIVLVKVA